MPTKSPRRELLEEAVTLIDGERNIDYGDPIHDFQCTADFWQTYLDRIILARGGLFLKPHDVAQMMGLLKTSRITWSPHKRDHWVDQAGYSGCGWDCVERESWDAPDSSS